MLFSYFRIALRNLVKQKVYSVINAAGLPVGILYVSGGCAPALNNDFPAGITHAVRVMPEKGLVTYGDKPFPENKLFFADSAFFEVFSYPLRRGDPRTVLDKPSSLVLTRETARKCFGDADPVGKPLDIDNDSWENGREPGTNCAGRLNKMCLKII